MFISRTLVRILAGSLLFAGTILTTACDQFTVADAHTYHQCATGVLLTQAEYDKLTSDAELGKNVNRYQTFEDHTLRRTYRIDPSTGKACLLVGGPWDSKLQPRPASRGPKKEAIRCL